MRVFKQEHKRSVLIKKISAGVDIPATISPNKRDEFQRGPAGVNHAVTRSQRKKSKKKKKVCFLKADCTVVVE